MGIFLSAKRLRLSAWKDKSRSRAWFMRAFVGRMLRKLLSFVAHIKFIADCTLEGVKMH